MTMQQKIYWLHCLTPVHIGAGQGVGFIDLPIMREKITNWPIVPGSALKGVQRERFKEQVDKGQMTKSLFDSVFGSQGEGADQAGALVYSDARIVLFPVRSFYGTFAYVTSSLVLRRLQRDLRLAGIETPQVPADDGHVLLYAAKESDIISDEQAFLDELDFKARQDVHVAEWAEFLAQALIRDEPDWQQMLIRRFAVVPDHIFQYFCVHGTEVNARIRIGPQRTVEGGALWYEESLPAETVLAGLVWCDRVYGNNGISTEQIMNEFCTKPQLLQIGAKATVGKGRVRCLFGGNE
jgi:CRISPR-associated protein Cmr4